MCDGQHNWRLLRSTRLSWTLRAPSPSQIKHVFLYAVNPMHTLVRFDEMAAVHPRDDAFTSSLKALMRHACAHGTLPAGRCSPAAARTATGTQHLRGGGGATSAAASAARDAETR